MGEIYHCFNWVSDEDVMKEKKQSMAKYIKVIVVNHGDGKIELKNLGSRYAAAIPVELHYKANGSLKDEPSFAMVMEMPTGFKVYGEFSLQTLSDCLEELGYEIKHHENT